MVYAQISELTVNYEVVLIDVAGNLEEWSEKVSFIFNEHK